MTDLWIHPSLILLVGAVILPMLPKALRKPFLVAVPVLAFADVLSMQGNFGVHGVTRFLDWTLTFGRVDALSMVFAYIMTLMCVIGTIYGLHVEEPAQHSAAWTYVAGSLGVIFCGDYLVLFLFWEIMAFSSVFLVWFRGRKESLASGYRYLLVHTAGGLLLLAGLVLRYQATGGDISFGPIGVASPQLYTWLILAGFILNAAVPPLHAWLPDAYGEATVTGSVFMCAFTTKTAVYALARGFAGMEILVPLGVCMALYGVVYAVLENDSRRLLAYHIISQVGYMVAGVGIGTELAINGACAHAFAHILYKGLLFMGCGAVLHMTGKSKFTELGGLYKRMPRTFVYTLIGGLSISAFPLFSGFVSKAMIVAAGFEVHNYWAAFLLTLASAGTFLHTGLKVPYFIWFGKNNCSEETWKRASDPPMNMQVGMILASILCIFIGCYTPYLYKMLPFPQVAQAYEPYTAYHLSETLQILLFTALGFFLLLKKLTPEPKISLDLDWFYRMGGRAFYWFARKPVQTADDAVSEAWDRQGVVPLMKTARYWSWFDWHAIDGVVDGIARTVREYGEALRTFQSGRLQLNIIAMLALVALALALLAAA
ncbi:Na(+)/H(+) antiporter subunit D [Fundidesulfovibrio magnetotacticus]|uniref:Na(+)/H(+) antiporter subunit D n=1 Tax=Fundidesulfovibrio magnetotacticus TaxID=2730080 RepID=A0A6V8LUE6_9BACT|nr:Na(+)/H(+) antiporter subunit D [Fundidesulfovibrio magnetotacticus]GFK94201.1 Na(+)/H(+) antiporter subunit D [Fundidesulfovibrio magnetotacticus]